MAYIDQPLINQLADGDPLLKGPRKRLQLLDLDELFDGSSSGEREPAPLRYRDHDVGYHFAGRLLSAQQSK